MTSNLWLLEHDRMSISMSGEREDTELTSVARGCAMRFWVILKLSLGSIVPFRVTHLKSALLANSKQWSFTKWNEPSQQLSKILWPSEARIRIKTEAPLFPSNGFAKVGDGWPSPKLWGNPIWWLSRDGYESPFGVELIQWRVFISHEYSSLRRVLFSEHFLFPWWCFGDALRVFQLFHESIIWSHGVFIPNLDLWQLEKSSRLHLLFWRGLCSILTSGPALTSRHKASVKSIHSRIACDVGLKNRGFVQATDASAA